MSTHQESDPGGARMIRVPLTSDEVALLRESAVLNRRSMGAEAAMMIAEHLSRPRRSLKGREE